MQNGPKLKKAMEELKAIAKKYDLGAVFTIHAPGVTEHSVILTPSYSCLKWEGQIIRIRARAKEDYSGDEKARDKAVYETADLLRGLGHVGAMQIGMILKVSAELDKQLKLPPPEFEHRSNSGFEN